MNAEQGEMTVSKANIFGVILYELRQHGRKNCAARSLEIPVFDEGHCGIIRPVSPVLVTHRGNQRLLRWTWGWLAADDGAVCFSLFSCLLT
jgi:hypothetical protein